MVIAPATSRAFLMRTIGNEEDSDQGKARSQEAGGEVCREEAGGQEEVTPPHRQVRVSDMLGKFVIAVAVAALSCPVGAEAASITNRDAKEYKVTIIEIGRAPVDHVLKKDGQLKDVCIKGCIVRLNDSENDEYELEGTEIVSIEEGYLYYDVPDVVPEAPKDPEKKPKP